MAANDPNLPIIAPNPVDTPELYETFKLAGVWSPGICSFDPPPKRSTGWDLQAPPGGNGGYTIKRNAPPIRFSVRLELWKGDDGEGGDVDHFTPWETFKRILPKPIKKNSKRALAIYHPQLAGLIPPVTDVVVEDWHDMKPDGQGRGIVVIDFIEYYPFIVQPVKALDGTTTAKNDPNAEDKAKVDLATKEFQDPGTLSAADRARIGL